MRIDLCGQTKSAWDKDGLKTLEVNRAIMEFIATDIQPFSVVQDSGFKRLIALLKPQYNLPSRNFFSEKMLPCIYESVKKRVIKDLLQAEAISVTFDAWTASLMHIKKQRLQITDDPFKYWSGENSIKWPLLTKLSHRYFSAPATSSESERFIENKFYFNPLNF
uniref:HAT C-terminal dimerisation domain-containing protein n=1 Tax=Meloidogyne floridensis TaxID=298350 RepID=A0A915PEF9_9BILA